MKNIITLSDLHYVYADGTSSAYEALKGVSLTVEQGQIFGILGPNGAGKSTLIELICGKFKPTGGAAEVLGMVPHLQRSKLRKKIGYMHQRFSLYPNLTFAENFQFFGRLHGVSERDLNERIRQISRELEIGDWTNAIVASLPIGMKQRLSFAIAQIHHPKLIILDEPTAGVDPWTRKRFWEEIFRYREAGETVIVCTHSMDEALHCDMLCLIASGQVKAMGSPADLLKHHGGSALGDIFYLLTKDSR